MRANVIRIGNSRGVRIPKSVLVACGIDDAVDLSVVEGKIVLAPVPRARQGWAEAAQAMARHGDDAPIDPAILTRFDEDAWEW